MALWSRIANVFRGDRLNREIDEELAGHLEEAIEEGRDPAEARRAFGSTLRQREAVRDVKVAAWLDSLRSDVVFGWRQLIKRKATSAAAILSLALAIGSSTAAFRLIDALLLRPLPVNAPERLYAFAYRGIDVDGIVRTGDACSYPLFRQMRAAVKDQAELIAVSYAVRRELTFRAEEEPEKVYLQYVSGWMFRSFGLRPALGRLLTQRDDAKPGTEPVAVLSYDYWTRRFGRDPKIIGHTFQFGKALYEIVGVAGDGFSGIEPGKMTDIFVPTMMNPYVGGPDWVWFRTLVRLKPGHAAAPVRDRLQAVYRSFQEEQVKRLTEMPKQARDNMLKQKVLLEPAATGVSEMQSEYREALLALGVLVALVLLIACANVTNLMTAQAAARAREMALRVSIGAGRARLVQMVLVESALVAVCASLLGGLLAWWSAPLVVSRINPPDDPARLLLPADWRVLLFGIALTFAVALLLGLAPALRASGVKPAAALKGGEDPHARRHLMYVLIGAQVAFCFLVLFVTGLLVTTFQRLSQQCMGFSAERLLTLETVAGREQPEVYWEQAAERLRSMAGVEAAALADFPLMSGSAEGGYISVGGGRPFADPAFFLNVSPSWMKTMRIPLMAGRAFRADDVDPKVAIVNEAFANRFFRGEEALGKTFTTERDGKASAMTIVGLAENARYVDVRGPMPPVAYFPFRSEDDKGVARARNSGAFIVRTFGTNPLALASVLRKEVTRAGRGFRVSNMRKQEEIDAMQTMRERLVASLALFFAAVALLLAGVGLYGVLDYSVFQRRREIGIRMAVGARAGHIGRLITLHIGSVVLAGAIAGLGLGMASVRYLETLLYHVKGSDLSALALPSLSILAAALLAALPALIHAVRIDPVEVLRAE